MYLGDAQLTAGEVLRAFQHDELRLFLGAAFTTVGLVSAGFCLIRRRADALLISLAAFAFLYGLRMWLDADILILTMRPSEWFHWLRHVVNPLVPVPAFIFFQAAGLLPRRGKPFTYAAISMFLLLTVLAAVLGWVPILHEINNVIVTVALVAVVAQSILRGSSSRAHRVLRGGLLVFAGLALWDNTGGPYLKWPEIEVYGFAVFLACMGYVAALHLLQRDQELVEMKQELELARRIQLSILPEKFPESTRFAVAARYVPMTAVAGDLYDFLLGDDRYAGLLIADVSGHGVPAALIASMVKMAATSQRAHAAHPAKLLAGMNAALCGNTQGQFVTAAYVHLDAQAGQMRYAAAGHPSMLLLRGGQVTEISENGLLLSASEDSAYGEKALPLEPGDRLLLYTDGMLEARNAEGAMFGEESLFKALRGTAGATVAEAADKLIGAVQHWAKSQDDDLTVLVCDFVGVG